MPAKPVVITFDDGWIECYLDAFPVLQQYGLTASFFIPPSGMGDPDDPVMTWEQIEELSRAGMEIGSHAMTHPYLNQLEPDQLWWELENSKTVLEEHVGGSVEVLAYPFGIYDGNIIEQAQAAGYRAALTIEDGLSVTLDNLFQLPRLTVLYSDDLDTFKAMIAATD